MLPALLTSFVVASAPSPRTQVHDLRLDVPTSAIIAGSTGAAWVASEVFFKHALAPDVCRWCDVDAAGNDALNPIDAWARGIRWENELLADSLSNLDGFVALPIALGVAHAYAASSAGATNKLPEDGLIVVEAVAACAVLNQATKFLVGRERPFVHALPEADKPNTLKPDDNNMSFFSGHASFAFSLAVAAGTVAELRGYPNRALIWAVGLPLATAVPVLRMMADRHYLSDVLVGIAIGSAFGAGVPLLFHSRTTSTPLPVTLAVTPSSVSLSARF